MPGQFKTSEIDVPAKGHRGRFSVEDIDRVPATNKGGQSADSPPSGSGAGASSGGGDAPAAKYKFGSTQAAVPKGSDAAKSLAQARDRIPNDHTAGKGKETEPHVTVRYGIQGEDTAGIKKYLASLEPFDASLGKTDSFPPSEHSDGAAVIIAPVESPKLHEINSKIEEHGDFTEPSFKAYRPHATISYVKPEVADRYKGMSVTDGKKFSINEIAITDRQGNKEVVKLEGGAKALARERERIAMDGNLSQKQRKAALAKIDEEIARKK